MKTVLTILALLVIVGGLVWYVGRDGSHYPANNGNQDQVSTSTAGQPNNSGSNSNSGTTSNPTSADIRVTSPMANAVVVSPLTVTGEARGTWYFEASFPVKLLDANGNVIAQTPALGLGEWMTTNFVPFSATLSFTLPTSTTGTLVLENDNPSGLPQNAKEIRIPIRFR